MTAEPVSAFLRGCAFAPHADAPYPRANLDDRRLPADIAAAARGCDAILGVSEPVIPDAGDASVETGPRTRDAGHEATGVDATRDAHHDVTMTSDAGKDAGSHADVKTSARDAAKDTGKDVATGDDAHATPDSNGATASHVLVTYNGTTSLATPTSVLAVNLATKAIDGTLLSADSEAITDTSNASAPFLLNQDLDTVERINPAGWTFDGSWSIPPVGEAGVDGWVAAVCDAGAAACALTVGVKVTAIRQVAPAATDAPQVLVCVNSVAFGPPKLMPVMGRA